MFLLISESELRAGKLDLLFVVGGIFVASYLLFSWIKRTRVKLRDNPWDAEVEAAVQKPDAVMLCHHCLHPQENTRWFCPDCGASTGPCNNYMPYVYLFAQGEVFRNGATMRLPKNALMIGGYLLTSLVSYNVFVPVFWYRFFKNINRSKPIKTASDDAEGT